MNMDSRQQSFPRKKMTKQLTGKREDTPLHFAARAGNAASIKEAVSGKTKEELEDMLSRQNQPGETPLYVAAEYGYVELVAEMIKHYNATSAAIKAKNGYDALHIAARQGDADVVKELLNAIPELSMTADLSNTTALHTAAAQGHTNVVNLLLEADSTLALIAKSNGKTALHSAARGGHLDAVKAILSKQPGISFRIDQKGQNALHMAAKGASLEIVEELLNCEPALINLVDAKGNTALHIASRKGRHQQIAKKLLENCGIDCDIINKSGETPLDTAEKMGNSEVWGILAEQGIRSARAIRPSNPVRELKQTVSDIKHQVHSQLEHSRQTRKRVKGIAKKLDKLHIVGLNNAINSSTVVAVLIATVAFAAIFTVPGQYVGWENLAPGLTVGEAKIARQTAFMIFFVFDSLALFISLAVVIVQTSVVVIENRAKKRMTAIIGKLMWVACVLISVSYLALCFVVVGKKERHMALAIAAMGTLILAATLGTMCFCAVSQRIQRRKIIRRSSLVPSGSQSADSGLSEVGGYKKMYAI